MPTQFVVVGVARAEVHGRDAPAEDDRASFADRADAQAFVEAHGEFGWEKALFRIEERVVPVATP